MKLTRWKLMETIRRKNDGWTTYQTRKIAGVGIRRVNQVYSAYLETGKLLFGRIRGDEDGVTRACCGMLDAMLGHIARGEQVPSEFEHLKALSPEIVQTNFDDPEAYSAIMWKATLANMRAQTMTIIDGLVESHRQNEHAERYVLAEGIAINRQKYPHTGILRGLYIIEGTKVHDLSKAAYKTVDSVATEMLANKID